MDIPPPPAGGPGIAGCLLAPALGGGVVVGHWLAFSLLTGRPFDPDDKLVFLWHMLSVAAPFALLALMDVGRWPWLTALALTLAFWGYTLWEGVSYQWNSDGSGANIGLGLIMLVSPLFIAGASLGVFALQERGRRDLGPPPPGGGCGGGQKADSAPGPE